MKAHELLDCDHQPTADNAADLLRTMARIVDNLRHLAHIIPGGPGSWTGFPDAQSVIEAHWRIQSGEAPVEDWLDDQWAGTNRDVTTWPEAAQRALLDAVLTRCPECHGATEHEPGCSLDAAIRSRPWLVKE